VVCLRAAREAGEENATVSAIFLSPHNDDETLFGSFSILSERFPTVIVCLRSQLQLAWGVNSDTREAETHAACEILGAQYIQLSEPDENPNWRAVANSLRAIVESEPEIERIYVPAGGKGVPEQHAKVGELAAELFPEIPLARYLTYRGSAEKDRSGVEVVPKPWMIEFKLRALAVYISQHEIESGSRRHFMEDLREYVAP
jgi:LmbE family N-acetylglucosaminyl deacetylase